jgi:hypothetical protein
LFKEGACFGKQLVLNLKKNDECYKYLESVGVIGSRIIVEREIHIKLNKKVSFAKNVSLAVITLKKRMVSENPLQTQNFSGFHARAGQAWHFGLGREDGYS